MAKIQQNYDIVISVDAGYNGSKVTVNGVCFEIQVILWKLQERVILEHDRKDGFICMKYLEGQSHFSRRAHY